MLQQDLKIYLWIEDRGKHQTQSCFCSFMQWIPVKLKPCFYFFSFISMSQCWKSHPAPVLEKANTLNIWWLIYIIQIPMWWIIHGLVGFCGYLSLLLIACCFISVTACTACVYTCDFFFLPEDERLGLISLIIINHIFCCKPGLAFHTSYWQRGETFFNKNIKSWINCSWSVRVNDL